MKNRLIFLYLALFMVACGEKKASFELPAPNPAEAIFYQINVREFTEAGSFKAMLQRLPELKQLGVNTLVLSPIHPIGLKNRQGKAGSLYASTDFKGIHPELGSTKDFREWLDSCHANGLYVLLEWAATRTAADHPWITRHPHWFKADSLSYPLHPGAATAELTLQDSLLQQELTGIMRYWTDTMGVDGFYASEADAFSLPWWSTTINSLRASKPLFFVANSENNALLKAGFDLLANQKRSSEIAQLFDPTTTNPAFTNVNSRFQAISEKNAADSTLLPMRRFGNRKAALLAALMNNILPGQPYLVAGEEVGQAAPLLPYDKNFILWSTNADIRSFYSTLHQLRKTHEALRSESMSQDSLGQSKIVLLRRGAGLNSIYCLVNPTDSLATLQVPLDLQGKRFTDLFTGRSVLLEKELLMLDYSFYLLKEEATS